MYISLMQVPMFYYVLQLEFPDCTGAVAVGAVLVPVITRVLRVAVLIIRHGFLRYRGQKCFCFRTRCREYHFRPLGGY